MNIAFSIVTVSFNQAEFLETCIRSVLDQGVPVEHIVIDGGSTDGSLAILERYSNRLTYWVSEPDRGPADALNKGFALATGSYIGYLNSDDYLLPGALKLLEGILNQHPGHDVYYGPGYILDEPARKCVWAMPTRWSLGVYRCGLCVMFQQSIFFRLAKLREAGIEFRLENTTHWDGEHLVDLDLAGAKFFRHGTPLGVFRIHDGSLTGGALGEPWKEKYRLQVQNVAERISVRKPGLIRNRYFWLGWLVIFDPLVMIGRVFRKLAGSKSRKCLLSEMSQMPDGGMKGKA